MSVITMAVSVEGLDFEDWGADFRIRLAASPQVLGLSSEVSSGAGALGAKRRPSVKVRAAEPSRQNGVIDILGVVISALSLAIAASQFYIQQNDQSEASPDFVCRVEGPKGVHELRIHGAAIPPEAVLRMCLDATGTPTHVKAIASRRP